MIKKLFIAIFVFSTLIKGIAQPYGNEWINYQQQKYLKFPIVKNGVYKINYTVLTNGLNAIGENINTIDPRRYQIFGRGKQIPIHIEGETDGVFNSTDFIEFYAEQNDGWHDSSLYRIQGEQTNPYYSNFSDTAYYFLTWNNSTSNLRMETINDISFPTTPAPYFYKEEVIFYSDIYHYGKPIGQKYSPYYTSGEGWIGASFDYPQIRSIPLSTKNYYTSAGLDAILETTFLGTNNNFHSIQLKYGLSNTLLFDTTWSGQSVINKKFTLSSSLLSDTLPIHFELQNTGLTQKTSVAFCKIKYPHTFNMENTSSYTLYLPWAGFGATYVKLTNFNPSNTSYIYDLTDGKRIKTVQTGSIIEAKIPPSAAAFSEKKCFVINDNLIENVSVLTPVTNTGFFTEYSETINPYIIITHPILWSSAVQYQNYRNTTGYGVLLVNIDELYDQFAYGIKKHPLAIRNFLKKAWFTWTEKPQHVLLLGKSIMDQQQYFRKNSTFFQQNLIPSYSYPAADNCFTEGFLGIEHIPALQMGRIAATNNSDVLAYLNKLISYENQLNNQPPIGNISERLWHKNIVHFGGGTSSSEQSLLKGYLRSYQDTIQKSFFGGKVSEFYKATADAIDFNLADSIKNIINNGVKLLSFFGHSTANSFDINIDQASNYDNKDKYFFLLSNGCFSGDLHQPSTNSISEDFVLIPEKGAVGFIAQSHLGIASNLHYYSREFYYNLSNTMYNEPIGKIMQKASEQSINKYPGDLYTYTTSLEMILHGDPALKFSNTPLPDYAIINPSQLKFEPENVSTDLDSFHIIINVANLGKAIDTNVTLQIRRIFPDNSDTTYTIELNNVYYNSEVKISIPVLGDLASGLNTFEVRVDPFNFIEEISEFNNNILLNDNELWISSEELTPVYPYNYAVVNNSSPILKASTNDPVLPVKKYIIQIDTSDFYNSPIKKDTIINSAGGVIEWKVSLPVALDSTVYFWRASPYSTTSTDLKWKEHSFQYIPNKNGWGQDHFFQLKNNTFNNINYIKDSRTFSFDTTSSGIICLTKGSPVNSNDFDNIRYEQNGSLKAINLCGGVPVIYVAVFDPLSLKPWGTKKEVNGNVINPDNDFGNGNNMNDPIPINCRGYEEFVFAFMQNDAEQMDSLYKMLLNKIPNGHYILAYSAGWLQTNTHPNINSSGIKNAFQTLGFSQINSILDYYPWIFFTKKGDLSTVIQKVGTSETDLINVQANLKSTGNYGEITSTIIGPSKKWKTLHWAFNQSQASDSIVLEVLDINNQVITSYNTISGEDLNLETNIPASIYPQIKLRAKLKDGVFNSPLYHHRWHVLFDEVPELALNHARSYLFYKDTLSRGDRYLFNISVQNISKTTMDSVQIAYKITDENKNLTERIIKKHVLILPEMIISDTLIISTSDKKGKYTMAMEVNPKDSVWQLEQFHFNNIISKNFFVTNDTENPLLDVTFDGVHILDGDIVSPNPNILITLRDNNEFLLLNEDSDTANFNLSLQYPNGQTKPINFESNALYDIQYTLSKKASEPFSIQFEPKNLDDGKYVLRVQAQDKSGNKSGKTEYSISFEVINKSSITQILNYPNPFSTSTRFVFTLTGSVIPDVFKIQILTASGKIVREITKEELGPIRIGRNITDFAWDGTDEYGDKLANGVYIYRVITKINGNSIENRETQADQYFNRGFGKMYLMR